MNNLINTLCLPLLLLYMVISYLITARMKVSNLSDRMFIWFGLTMLLTLMTVILLSCLTTPEFITYD